MRASCFENISARLGRPTETSREVLARARNHSHEDQPDLHFFMRRFDSIEPSIRHVTRVLFGFEVVQLLVIFVSLVGFSVLDKLTKCWLTSVGLWVLASLAVGSTAYCVLAWMREGEDFKED